MHPDFNSLTCWRGLGIFFEIWQIHSFYREIAQASKLNTTSSHTRTLASN